MIKAVIFDMDGLLIDTELLQSKSFELLIRSYDKKPIFQENGLIHDIGTKGNIQRIIIEKHGIKGSVESLTKKRRRFYRQLLEKTQVKIMPGGKKLLEILKKKNLKLAIASNAYANFVNILIKRVNLEKYFDAIVTIDDVLKPKPFPDLYLETAKKLKVKPKNCLVLEDSEAGVIAAKKAKMKVIAVPSKYTKHQDFSKADKIVESLKNIDLNLINSL